MLTKIIIIDKSNINNIDIDNKENIFFFPIDIEGLIFLKQKKLLFENPINFIDQKFYKESLIETNKIISYVQFDKNNYPSINENILSKIRFNIYFYFFLKIILDNLIKKFGKIEIIIKDKNYKLNKYILKFLKYFNSYSSKLIFSEDIKNDEVIRDVYNYKFESNININVKSILLNNIGYNFKRILFFFKFKGYQVIHLEKQNSFRSKIINKILFLKKITYKKYIITNNNSNKINIKYNNINDQILKNYLHNLKYNLDNELINNYNYANSLNLFLQNFKNIEFLITNINKGNDGIFSSIAKKINSKSVIISHGTLTNSFDQYDKIYKTIISNQVHSEDFDYAFSQSKISDLFFKQSNSQNYISSGNIIFSHKSSQTKIKSTKMNILYAVTQKNINNLQFFGCEMYYEFLDNLEFLNNIAYNKSIKIFVKLHPSVMNNESSLSKIYTNLTFVKYKINLILKKIDITCSFSSTVIEDSLNMKIPVILLDRWKRYRHTKSQTFPFKDDYPIMYANDKKQFLSALDFTKKIKYFNFEQCIYTSHYFENIKKSISKII